MRILQFKGIGIHGYLNVSPEFNQDLTFLTGINGSGKTSVVRGISALLSPSLLILANTIHERMELHIQHQNDDITIWSSRDAEHLDLGTSETEEHLTINIVPATEYRHADYKRGISEYYEELETRYADHEVMRLIRSLPTPMILGIDRRSRELIDTVRVSSRALHMRRRRENVFRTSLSASLDEAIYLAERRYRTAEAQRLETAESLRERIILNALKYEEFQGGFSKESLPKRWESQRLTKRKATAAKTLTDLGLPEEYVREQLDPFFNKLSELFAKIPEDLDIDDFDPDIEPELLDALMEWTVNRPQLERIVRILDAVDEHVKKIQEIRSPIQDYQDAINSFLNDSGKHLQFNESGDLCVMMSNGRLEQLTSLSSGESQLVVILTHLAFNPAATSANVFIVDEPELSLHVKWQEAFVPAIRKANPDLQVILATHSPSVVLDLTKHCVDISEVAN